MNPISLAFNANSIAIVKNLATVLAYIRGKEFNIEKYEAGILPEPLLKYITELQEKYGLIKEDHLSVKVIQLINKLLIDKKYKDPVYIHELHTWFQTLGYTIDKEELIAKFIGPTTKTAIEEAEQKYDLGVTGQMSLSLENRLRTAYEASISRGVKTELLQIHDIHRLQKIIAPLSLNDEGDRVQHLQLALAWLGYTIYKEEYRQASYGKQTRLAVIAYQKDHELEASGKLSLTMANHLNNQLLISKPTLLDKKNYRVRGSVKDGSWVGIGEAKVQVFEQVLRGKRILLGEKTTMKNGFYDLLYTPPVNKTIGKTKEKFHLIVQISDPKGKLLKELTFFNVLPTTWANYTGGSRPYLGKSLYEEQLALLRPHLEGLRIEEIEESQKNKDIQYLNACSGLAGNEIMLLSLAHRVAQVWKKHQIDPSILYAFFKQQLPQSLPSYLLPDEPKEWRVWIKNLVEQQATAIALMPKETQEAALQKAGSMNLIPVAQYNELSTILKRLVQVRQFYAEKAPLIGKGIALRNVLNAVAKLPKKERKAIVDHFSELPVFSAEFIDHLATTKKISNATQQQLHQEYLLLQLGDHKLAATTQLRTAFQQDGYSAVIRQVSDFAKWTEEDWEKFLAQPQQIKRKALKRRVPKPASSILPKEVHQRALALAPTVATVATLGKKGSDAMVHIQEIAAVIDNQQWLNLTEVSIAQAVKDGEINLSKEAVEELKTIQRVQKIATSPTATAILLQQGVQSAQKAFSMGTAGIATSLQQGGLSSSNANTMAAQIFNIAQQQVGAVVGLGTLIQMIGNNELPTNVLPKLTNLEELFGSTDTCGCQHCRSVYSPAAYLTDLLQWLKQKNTGHGDEVTRPLFYRRPDLEYILLNCENAHTPLPYIDLVNEVLEYAISKDPAYLDRNTTWDAQTLSGQPEYQWDPVYEQFILAPNHPQYKPYASYNGFNLWQSQFHLFLEKLGVNVHDFVQSLGNYSSLSSQVMAETAAYFKMPSHEVYDVITNYYDYATHPAASNNVEQFLMHHDLSYEQLIELLQCLYINGNGAITISPLDTCTLADRKLIGLNNTHYNKIWRFLRLWKYTGWQLWELDLAINHPLVGQGNLNLQTLAQITKLHSLQQNLEASVEDCLTLFGAMNTQLWYTAQNETHRGLYQRVYMANHLNADTQASFSPDNIQVNLQNLSAEELNYIATALSTNISTVQTILDLPQLALMSQAGASVKQATTLLGLSNLYAYTWLSQQLKVSPEVLVKSSQLLYAGTNVFQDLSTFQQFLADWEDWQLQGNPVETVAFLTQHQDTDHFVSYAQIEDWHQALHQLLEDAYHTTMGTAQTDRDLLQELFTKTGKFDTDLALEAFLDVLDDPANYPASYTSLNNYLTAVVPIYFDYASATEQNDLISNIGNIAQLKQLLHRYINVVVVYEFLEQKLNLGQEFLVYGLSKNHPHAGEKLLHYFVPEAGQPFALDVDTTIAYVYMYKFGLLVATQKLNLDAVEALSTHGAVLNTIQPDQIPVPTFVFLWGTASGSSSMVPWTIEQWNNTWAYGQLCQQYNCDMGLFLAALSDLNSTGNFAGFFAQLEQLLGWEANLLTTLQNHFGWTSSDFLVVKHYNHIAKIVAWLEQSQESIEILLGWLPIFDINASNYSANQKIIAGQAQQSLQNRVAAPKWQQYQKQIQDKIRLLKRDALVAYARHYSPTGSPVLLSVNELYKYYLIDPAMSSCQYTSRLKQAISSVQFFIQRCLMGLEDDVNPSTDDSWKEWEWMQNYRVWEANRKVFLYPENWIDPALRDNKSELFKQFEDQLLQNEITNENVERALQEYLVKLHHISNLEMKSICQGADQNTIYVLARTKENPADYYYRKLNKKTGAWTAWEKIEPLIKGEHPVLQFYNNRLHIFWLEILERPQRQVLQHDTPPLKSIKFISGTSNAKKTIPEPPKYKEIQLAWIVLYETGWSPQTLSKQKLIHPWPRPQYSLHLRPRPKLNDLWLDIYVSTSLEFNGRYFYNQFNNSYEKLTTETFNENQKPWHSSSFVYDGFVREIKLKPISGTYWYVGWEKNLIPINSYTQTIPLTNTGPIWIRNLQDVDLSATAGNPKYEGEVKTNYGDFDLKVQQERDQFNQLVNTTRVKNNSFSPIVVWVQGVYKDSSMNRNHFVVAVLWTTGMIHHYYLTKEAFNSYLHTEGFSANIPEPTTSQTITTYDRELVPASNPDHILRLNQSDSYEYIYHSFDKEGRQLKQLLSYEQEAQLDKPNGMHYEFNHLVPNASINDGTKNLEVLKYTNSVTRLMDKKQEYKLTIPLDGGIHVVEQYNDVLYQDDLRSFYLTETDAGYQSYNAYAMYHPLVRNFIGRLGSSGLDGLYDRKTQFLRGANLDQYYQPTYNIDATNSGSIDLHEEQVKFNYDNGYGIYNWEIFFHIPLLVGTELSKNQRFEEAMKWFHFIFNPMGVPYDNTLLAGSDASKYWITKPFFKHTQSDYQNALIQNLLGGTLSEATKKAIAAWRDNPFQPHLIARMRPVAYQKAVVMKYIDNLLAWGDQLFRRETLESINQAALRYIVAAEILGEKPATLANKNVEDEDFASLRNALDDFSNGDVTVQLENFAMWTTHPIYAGASNTPTVAINTKYFCIPKNDKLAGYWDLVADRLFKIRHCMNIDGVVRQLPLFAPPIDPALLVNAQANGVNLGDVLNDLSLPKTHYKYRTLVRLATQFCNEVKGLGQSLLSALQSKDAEGMALLQAGNALKVLDATIALKELQIEEAEESIKSLELSKAAAAFRKEYYEGKEFMNIQEQTAEKMNRTSITLDTVGTVLDGIAGVVTPIPEVEAIATFPPGVKTSIIDGQVLGTILRIASGIIFKSSSIVGKEANMASTQGSFHRRQEEWQMQADLASRDVRQIEQQIATAKIRVDIAKKDLANHLLQIDNAKSEQEYLQSKYTNQQLYSWMTGQISGIYFQAYQLAFDMAKKAEKSMRYELALPTSIPSMISFGYWNSMKKGLLAGDKLLLAIHKMEATYVEKNSRELELTKHISLRLLAPEALMELKTTGSCNLQIPQWWFDLDYPGHYLRRIKSLSLSIPCVVGPHTNVACTLTMTKNSIQAKDGSYMDYYETESIATSSAQNDAGVFELNFNGERFLPFEGAGAVSDWTLKLPDMDIASFDYQSITDVVLHMRYMARDGGPAKAAIAKTDLKNHLSSWSASHPPVAMISLKTAFPTAWHRLFNPTVAGNYQIDFDLMDKHYPYLSSLFANRTIEAGALGVLLKKETSGAFNLSLDAEIAGAPKGSFSVGINPTNPTDNKLYGNVDLGMTASQSEPSVANWKLDLSANPATTMEQVEDILLILKYKLS